MEKRHYKRVSDEEKVRALKRHLLERVAVSVVCDELGVAPSLFYTWQQRLFEQAVSVLGRKSSSSHEGAAEKRRTEVLQEQLRQREEALAELLTELLALKKKMSGRA
jgi:transposase-like protein